MSLQSSLLNSSLPNQISASESSKIATTRPIQCDNKPVPRQKTLMWRVTVYCSADSWRIHAIAFKEITAKYPNKLLSSKKMKDDERRIMEFQIDDVNDAESFQDECMMLEGFTAQFESL